jgi:hypothetical protein
MSRVDRAPYRARSAGMSRVDRNYGDTILVAELRWGIFMRWNAFLILATITAIAVSPTHAVEESEQLRIAEQIHRSLDALTALKQTLAAKAESSCDFHEDTASFDYFDPGSNRIVPSTYTLKVEKWTGGCIDGKRDGKGLYRTLGRTDFTGINKTDEKIEAEGTFVAGVPVGLWCYSFAYNFEYADHAPNCVLRNADRLANMGFQKVGDGKWQLPAAYFGVPPTEIPAGTLEAESDRIIAAARAGTPTRPLNISITSPALSNLTQGASIRLALKPKHIDLQGKRVALIYSDATLASMKQFPLDVQQALAAPVSQHSQSSDDRQQFIDAATVSRFTQGIGAPLLRKGITAVPANDLSVLSKGLADYVLLVDWRYSWRSDLSDAEFERMPVCEDLTGRGFKKCDFAYRQSLALYLIGPGPVLLAFQPDDTKYVKILESDDIIHEWFIIFAGVLSNPTSGVIATTIDVFVDRL